MQHFFIFWRTNSMPSEGNVFPGSSLAKPQVTDKYLAAAVHISSIFWPLLGPIVGWAFFRRNSFVAAHSKQALKETIVLNILVFTAGAISLSYTIFRIYHYVQTNWRDFSWQEFVLRFLIGWIVLGLLEVVNTVVSVRQALLAIQGRWPKSVKA